MIRPTQPTVVVALHDGFYGCGTGAGFTNHALLQILAGLLFPEIRLIALPIHLKPTSNEYDPTWHSKTTTSLNRVGAVVHPVDNGTNGLVRFGDVNCFRQAVRHTVEILTDHVLPVADPLMILALDVPFFGLAPLLPAKATRKLVLVPRSTAHIHAPHDRERIAWESHGLSSTIEHGGQIAAISRFMHRHLSIDYQVPAIALVELRNGLSSIDWHLTPPTNKQLLPIPAQQGFLLAMGRAAPYKGFDDLLDALTLLRNQNVTVPHLVLAAVTDDPEPSDYQRHLTKRITRQGLNVTLLTRFQPDIRRLLAHPALRGVIVPSRAEPFGRVPIESYAAGATPVIATTAGGLAEQVIDNSTGFTATPNNPQSLAKALWRALTQLPANRERMRAEARRFAARCYDYPGAVRAFLNQTAPWLEKPVQRQSM